MLGVKLDAEKWPTFMYYSLICLVVCIRKEDLIKKDHQTADCTSRANMVFNDVYNIAIEKI